MTCSDDDVVAELQESARTLIWLVKNVDKPEDHQADLEAINRVISYYGGTPVSEEEPKSADWTEGYEAGHEAGFKAGFERGAYEEMTKEDVK